MLLLAVLVFRSFYGSSEPGTPPHRDSIPSNPLRPQYTPAIVTLFKCAIGGFGCTRRWRFKPIPETTHGKEVARLVRLFLDLLPNPPHMHVHGPRRYEVLLAPDLTQQLLA
jgi:hypothetical protein